MGPAVRIHYHDALTQLAGVPHSRPCTGAQFFIVREWHCDETGRGVHDVVIAYEVGGTATATGMFLVNEL
jgi:hypothetical protein